MSAPPDADPPGPDWVRTESTTETVLDLGPVEVTTATVVFEDVRLRETVAGAVGLDRPWRFAFASRVEVPGSAGSRALRRVVTDRARKGFTRRLRDRGFESVERVGERSVGGREATRYVARVVVEGLAVDAEGWLAVGADEHHEQSFRLVGGAYPRRVASGPDETREALSGLFDPGAFRSDLLGFLRR